VNLYSGEGGNFQVDQEAETVFRWKIPLLLKPLETTYIPSCNFLYQWQRRQVWVWRVWTPCMPVYLHPSSPVNNRLILFYGSDRGQVDVDELALKVDSIPLGSFNIGISHWELTGIGDTSALRVQLKGFHATSTTCTYNNILFPISYEYAFHRVMCKKIIITS